MKRIIFDTSIYGKLLEDDFVRRKLENKLRNSDYIIYGNSIIRKELRNTPKHIILGNKKIRILLLTLYDSFVKKENHNLKINPLVERLSSDYFEEYKKLRGSFSKKELENDFIIVATAVIYSLDIIISNDERTMLSLVCLNVYKNVNKRYGLNEPIFKSYNSFKKELV
ncbi:PIN domain-containing protein [Candidatus Woesearchaeota archaeon]|nr:PIN domain-containing protein [Candidatus Woesearchaeota archaeon]